MLFNPAKGPDNLISMLTSGADLIRTSAKQSERLDRIRVVDPVTPVPDSGQATLDGDTQNALLRFARFVHKEKENKKNPPPVKNKRPVGIPLPYLIQIHLIADSSAQPGQQLNIYI